MRRHQFLGLLFLLLGLALGLLGCGGGGAGSAPTRAAATFFLTDDLEAGYDHVWITLHEVELEHSGGSTKVLNSDAGVSVDVRALNTGATNQFQFLGAIPAPTQAITSVKFKVGRNLTLFTTGATTGTSASFAPAFDTADGKSRFTLTPASAITVAENGKVAFDFDLSAWNLASGLVTPVARMFVGSGLDDSSNHKPEDWHGTVSGLAGLAPNQTFTLTTTSGTKLSVSNSVTTTVMFTNGNPNPALANGHFVSVRGQFDPSTSAIAAAVVRIQSSSSSSSEDKVKGLVRNPVASASSVEVRSDFVRGFVPANLYVSVLGNSSTTYFNRVGTAISKTAFFDSLTSGSIEAEGNFNEGTGVLTATKMKLEDGTSGSEDSYQEAKGPVTVLSASAGTMTISVVEWRGFSASSGSALSITTNSSTTYRNDSGTSMTREAFFAAAAVGSGVKVEGTYGSAGMVAKRLEFRANAGSGGGSGGGGGGSGNDPHEIQGTVSNLNPSSGTFTVTLVTWFGFSGVHGSTVNVSMGTSATFRNDAGDSITRAAFFEGLINGGLVEVEGTVSGASMSGVKAKLDND